MQPGFELRLRTMSKALAQVVIPAIDPSNRQAQEQAQLVAGSIDVIRQQIDHAQWYEAADLVSLCTLAEDLSKVEGLQTGTALVAARREGLALLSRWDITLQQLRDVSADLREAVSNIVQSAFAYAAKDIVFAVTQIVMRHAKTQIGRERAFVAAMKWDGYPESLQSIGDSLRSA